MFEENELVVGRRPRGAARLVEEHERQESHDLGVGKQLERQAREAHGLTRQIRPRQRAT